MLLGVITILVPISGFPSPIRSFLTTVLGVCVLGIGFSLRTRGIQIKEQSIEIPTIPPQKADQPAELEPPRNISPI
ncbi:hypothetical protein A3G63_00990 [Candidatus Kaiserbacteria bacterium RIFCSPLOWO2_12_FULL_52_8]|uniref:Uncharacterized protein n=1 Tax=Candidatus Kaiserbacteria bacterium RIFCSPHIGHO2_01_FULL_53_31 TaxID=1798481 RepID=A0A1F6CGA3_9BACT|nr:MAG: hypothetical protein A2678_01615 [Candidatus Kaiserbacteria bacterium RIFCSPHIGHO2_01_FULL_53_31]OGG92950.1 MAG: hypothetical protein A3G63_00990 [Candidatus Kaiserbacteria bacterium RIFCSPLOWO2_12_FULL_52_8]